jgi:RNA polymerase sigma-70 factor (ECF subfamily)
MGGFDTTRWSVVLQARGDPEEARRALEALCRTYRPPVLAYVRGRGYQAAAAEDLT